MEEQVLRERSEWCHLWWDHADDPALPRVLLIGDSITRGYRPTVTDKLKDKVHVDMFSTSKGVNDPAFEKELRYMLNEYEYVAVHFNNGLHASHMSEELYRSSLERAVDIIRERCPKAILLWAQSTPITEKTDSAVLDEKMNGQVLRRNETAAEVMKERGIPVNDLYSLIDGRPGFRLSDGYHYTEDGYRFLGLAVAERIGQLLPRG